MLLSVREKERRQHTIKAHHHRQQLPAFVNCIYTCMLNEKQTKNELQFQLKQLRLFHVLCRFAGAFGIYTTAMSYANY